MTADSIMRREVVLQLPGGLHLRPISQIARIVAAQSCQVTISNGEKTADAKSPFDLMSLKAEFGTPLTIEAKGAQAAEVIDAILPLLENEANLDSESTE